MNPDDVQKLVEEIAAVEGDSERSHKLEDELYTKVLEALASGRVVEVRVCAVLALTTKRLPFKRWYA